ncbi:MAG: methyl-accepting chemotaxis protein [Planctomycetota bacterium]|jgi:methyl-accepting chemotaxis protein|nr:methyl-accepting chemotaxis protein [Planctomycetota bacterium]
MKLSTKVFGIISLLILLAVFIMGLGLYGLTEITDALNSYKRISDRILSIMSINIVVQKAHIAEKNLIIETDDEKIQTFANSPDFKDAPAAINALVDDIRKTVNSASSQTAKDLPDRLLAITKPFLDAIKVSADLSIQNTNTKAERVLWENIPILAEYMKTIASVRKDIDANSEEGDRNPEILAQKLYIADLREQRMIYQRDSRALLLSTTTPEQRIALEKDIRGAFDKMLELIRKAPDFFPGQPNVVSAMLTLERPINQMLANVNRMADLANQNTNNKAFAYSTTTVRKARLDLEATISQDIENTTKQLIGIGEDSQALETSLFWTMIIASVIGIAVAAVIAFLVVTGITRNLNRIIAELDNGSNEVTAAAAEISHSSQTLAEGATSQAASLEETSSALEEMASMTRQNADNSRRTSENTASTVKLIGEGAVAVQNMTSSMAEINESAEQIKRIIKTIEDIAFQTNLLALNAAVEAARAGEAGKGFAVVADEVRNLAQRSAQAARDTTTLIESTVTRIHTGSEIATKLDASFKEIQDGSNKVGELIKEITSATNEQAQGVDQVNTAVAQMDKVTQQNAASAEESASASEELSRQADMLKQMIEELVIIVSGAGGRNVSASASTASDPAKRQQPRGGKARPQRSLPVSGGSNRPAAGGGKKVMKPDEVIPLDDDFNEF